MGEDNIFYLEEDDEKLRDISFSDSEEGLLQKIRDKAAASLNVEALIDLIFESSIPSFPCDRVSIAFSVENDQRLVAHYARTNYGRVLLKRGYAEDLQGSSLKPIIDSGCIRVINNLPAYLKEHPNSVSSKPLVREGIQSSITCPLAVEGRTVGMLFRSSSNPAAYGINAAALQRAMAERIAHVAEKAYRIEQLTEARNAYSEMLGFVTHELKSPIGSISMTAQMMAEGYLGELDNRQREKLESIVRQADHLLDLVGQYLNLVPCQP
jgi:transcriptional regulator with GAF, ATPase, and Fis domain